MTRSFEIDYLADIREFHRVYVEPFKGKPLGSDERDIQGLEEDFGLELPEAYKQFLRWMGNDFNGVFVGCDWFLRDVLANTEDLPGLLAENNIPFVLPEHYLCFFAHQGYMAAWFELPKQSDDPPSWFYSEATELQWPVVEGKFTDVLFKDMKGLASFLPDLYDVRS